MTAVSLRRSEKITRRQTRRTMYYVNSKNNANYHRQTHRKDNWQAKLHHNAEKNNPRNNPEAFQFNGTVHLKPGGCTVLLTLLLLSHVAGAGATNTGNFPQEHTRNNAGNAQQGSCTGALCSDSYEAGKNVVQYVALGQLIESKMVIDPLILPGSPEYVHCKNIPSKILQTVKDLPASEERIKRVVRQPEFSVGCSSLKRIKEVAFFKPSKKAIYFPAKNIEPVLISHEFIHADYFFRHTQAPYEVKDLTDAVLPVYPVNDNNIKKYQAALDKGDKRINDFKELMQKTARKEKLSRSELKRLNHYQEASKDCLRDVAIDGPLFQYDLLMSQLNDFQWAPGKTDLLFPFFDLEFGILEVKQKLGGLAVPLLIPADPGISVCMTTSRVSDLLNTLYKDCSEKKKLAERDANTFAHLSENAITTFYPEAHRMRTPVSPGNTFA